MVSLVIQKTFHISQQSYTHWQERSRSSVLLKVEIKRIRHVPNRVDIYTKRINFYPCLVLLFNLPSTRVYILWNTASHSVQFPKVNLVYFVVCVLQRAGFGRGRGGGGGGGGGSSGGGFGAPPAQ